MLERLLLRPGFQGAVWGFKAPGWHSFSHRHAELELNLVTSGSATYLIGDRRVTVAKRQLLWLPADQEHHLVQESNDLTMWIVVFSAGTGSQSAWAASTPLVRQLSLGDFRWLDRLCTRLSHSEDAQVANCGLAFLASEAYHAGHSQLAPVAAHPLVLATVRTLERDPDCSLIALAAAVRLTPDRLARLFRRELGTTLVAWRTRCRLERAITYHAQGKTWLTAALASGFGSYSQFHRAFTHQVGGSPRDWQDD